MNCKYSSVFLKPILFISSYYISTSRGEGIFEAWAMIFSLSLMAFLIKNLMYWAQTFNLAKQISLCSGFGYVMYDLMCLIAEL